MLALGFRIRGNEEEDMPDVHLVILLPSSE